MSSERCDLLIAGGTYLTVDADRRILHDGALAIDGGRIVAVGGAAQLAARYAPDRTLDATGKVVTPGLVNAHLHLSQHLYRGFVPDDVDPDDYVFDWAVPYYAVLEPEEEQLAVALACADLLRRGVTSVAEAGTLRFPAQAAAAVRESGIRAALGQWVWDLVEEPAVLRNDTAAALALIEAQLAALGADPHDRVRAMASVIGMGCCSDDLLTGAKALAEDYGAMLNLHQSIDVEEAAAWGAGGGFPDGPVTRLDALGLLDPGVRLIHLLVLGDREIELLGERQARVVRCYGTGSAYRLGELHAAGVSVSLGTDTVNVANTTDMLRTAHFAAAYCREDPAARGFLRAETALEMCTIEGARSLGQEAVTGSLEVGKQADVVLFDAERPEWVPNLDPVANLVYSADGGSVDMVLVGGEELVAGGRLTRVDERALYAEANAVAEGIVERTGLRAKRPQRWPVSRAHE